MNDYINLPPLPALENYDKNYEFMEPVTKHVLDEYKKFNEEYIEPDEKPPLPSLPLDNGKIILEEKCVGNENNNKCSPLFQYKSFSCIPLPIVKKIAKAYNKYVNNDKSMRIPLIKGKISIKMAEKYKRYLIVELSKKMGNDQTEWINSEAVQFLDNESIELLKNDVFRPKGPDMQYEWMDSIRLTKVMKQYEKLFLSFKYLDTLPIDFDKYGDYFNAQTMAKYIEKGKYKFAMIVNTQTYAEGGEHWFCIFINIRKGELCFIDSVGNRPMPEIVDFLEKIKNLLLENGITVTIKYNKTQHQRKNSECGIYSMYFVLGLLNDIDFDILTSTIISDEEVNKLRLLFFCGKPRDWRDIIPPTTNVVISCIAPNLTTNIQQVN